MKSIQFFILLTLLVITLFVFYRDKSQYERFQSLQSTSERLKFFRRWTIEPFLLYGVSSILILIWINEIEKLNTVPEFLSIARQSFEKVTINEENKFISGILKGMKLSIIPVIIIGSVFGTYFKELKEYKENLKFSKLKAKESNFRNLDALIPRNYAERIWGALLSVNAGFSEEIFFRLLVPILIYNVSGSVLFAILGSTIWFGLGHFYQGFSGMIITFLVGLFLFFVYLITQNIWITMLLHALLDINGLVLGPWLKERFSKQILS